MELEGQADVADLLCSEICKRYPSMSVSRPSRLFDTIVGPTRPSLRGTAKLTGSPLASYRRNVCEPVSELQVKYSNNENIFRFIFREYHCVSTRTDRAKTIPGNTVFKSLTSASWECRLFMETMWYSYHLVLSNATHLP